MANSKEIDVKVGIEIDGSIVRVAYVHSNKVVKFLEFSNNDINISIQDAMKSIDKKYKIVSIALTGGQQHLKQCSVPIVEENLMRPMLQSVAEDNLPIVPGMASVAAVHLKDEISSFSDDLEQVEENKISQMVICGVVSDQLEPIWKKIGNMGINISPSSFLLPSDGLYLRVSQSMAELLVVRGTRPVAARFLRIGGIESITKKVTEKTQEGSSVEKFMLSIKSSEVENDPAKIDEYLDALIAEVRKTIVFWKREGVIVPQNILVIGEGATLPTLDIRLRESQLVPMLLPQPPGYDIEAEEYDVPKFFQALSAAFISLDDEKYASLPNPILKQNASKNLSKNYSKLIFALVIVVILFALLMVPKMYFSNKLSNANKELIAAQSKLSRLGVKKSLNDKISRIKPLVTNLDARSPFFTNAICKIQSTLPGIKVGSGNIKTDLSNLTIADNGTTLNIAISAIVKNNTGGFTVAVSDWIENLKKIDATNIVTNTFSSDDEGQSVSFTFDLPRQSGKKQVESCGG